MHMAAVHINKLLIYICVFTVSKGQSSSNTVSIVPSSSLLSSSSTNIAASPFPVVSLLSSSTVDCSCDLMVGSCDGDCCCDGDCTANEIQLFSQCINTQQESSASRFCINEGLIFRSSLSNSVLSGLFCVYTDNYPGRRQFPSLDTVTTLSEATDKLVEFGTSTGISDSVPSFKPADSDYYRSGDPIEVIFDNEANGILPLPAALNSIVCNDGNPITYLNDQTSKCARYLSSDGRECTNSTSFNAEIFYRNFSVLGFPSSSEGDNYTSIPIEIARLSCYDLNGEVMACGDESMVTPVYDSNSSVCNNTLLSLSYDIIHNATQGIMSVYVTIDIGQVSIGYTTQSFSVKFMYFNESVSDLSLVRSGNPGYIEHEPVLAGVLTGSTINVSLDSSDWLTLSVGDSMGMCSGKRESITFKDNYRSSCIIRVSLESIFSGCNDVETLPILLGPGPWTDRIAIYGNADVTDLTQWVEILGINEDNMPLQVGCTIVTGVHLIVFYSYTGTLESPEAVITGAQFKYIIQDIEPMCEIPSCSSSSDIPIVLESIVTFVPVYTPPDEVLLSTMLTIRRLPHDFLYPLFTGKAVTVHAFTILTILSVLLVMLIN